MPLPDPCGPDWRDARAYEPLLQADRSLFAWEWLRRQPGYRLASKASGAEPGRATERPASAFGLVRFEPAELAVPRARPLWCADVHPYVLAVEPSRSAGEVADRFDITAVPATLAIGPRAEHILISDGLRMIRLDGPPGTFTSGPRCLLYRIEGISSAGFPLLTLRRLLALCEGGRFSCSLHPRQSRARRWILILRAHDALASGAGQRELARELLSPSAGEPHWRSREPSIRSRAQRLVRAVRACSASSYRAWLG